MDWVTKVTDPLSDATQYGHDKNGNVNLVTDPRNKQTTITLDALDRTVKTTDPNNNSTVSQLDAVDEGTGQTDGAGDQTEQVFNSLGWQIFDVSAVSGVIQKTYDGEGNLISLTDESGNTTKWIYNGDNQVVQEIDPKGNSKYYTWDDDGRETKYVDRNNREIDYAYFNSGLLQTETWKDSTGTVVNTINHTYNQDNQPLSVSDNAGEIDWTYDEVGRLATQKDVYGLILTYSWDTADRMTGVSDSLGGTETNVFDDASRVTSRQFTNGTTQVRLDYQYNADSQVTLEKRFSDTAGTNLIGQTSLGYDDGGRVTDINHKTAAGVTIDDFGYQYDQADRVTQETSTLGPTRNYGYDKAGEVVSDGTNNWTYDLTGNRTNTGYQTGTANQLVTDGTYNYTFDNEGNETKKVNIASGETWNYTFDNANRLTRAERHSSDGGPLTLLETMGYDAIGDRIQTSLDDDGSGPDPAVVTDYAYDRGNAWADLTQGGSLITRRLFQDALDSEFARIGSGGSVDWYLTDRLGSVRDLVDGSGAFKDHLDYSTFGQQIYESNPGYADRYTYASRENDSAIKLEYNRARYYDASTGRWMSQDPEGFKAGDSNLYRYVNNGPTNGTDPSGLQVFSGPHLGKTDASGAKSGWNYYFGSKAEGKIGGGFDATIYFADAGPGTPEQRKIVMERIRPAAEKIDKALDALENMWPAIKDLWRDKIPWNDYLFKPNIRDFYAKGLEKVSKQLHGGNITFEIERVDVVDVTGTDGINAYVNHPWGNNIHLMPVYFAKRDEDKQIQVIYHELGRRYVRITGNSAQKGVGYETNNIDVWDDLIYDLAKDYNRLQSWMKKNENKPSHDPYERELERSGFKNTYGG
jgi:RHS repeat-associated protein